MNERPGGLEGKGVNGARHASLFLESRAPRVVVFAMFAARLISCISKGRQSLCEAIVMWEQNTMIPVGNIELLKW